MEGRLYFLCEYFKTDSLQEVSAICFVKDVMVHHAILKIVQQDLSRFLRRVRMPVQALSFQNFVDMGEIVFTRILLEILKHVPNRCGNAASVEGPPIVRQDENDMSAGSNDSLPLSQALYRIREVFEVMRRQEKIIRVIRNSTEVAPSVMKVLPQGFFG